MHRRLYLTTAGITEVAPHYHLLLLVVPAQLQPKQKMVQFHMFNEARERSEPLVTWFLKPSKKKPLHIGSDARVGCLVFEFFCMSVCELVCVLQHFFGPPFPTPLDAQVTKSSPRGLCARTHTRKTRSRPGGVENHLQFVELGAAKCVGTCLCWAMFKIQNHTW